MAKIIRDGEGMRVTRSLLVRSSVAHRAFWSGERVYQRHGTVATGRSNQGLGLPLDPLHVAGGPTWTDISRGTLPTGRLPSTRMVWPTCEGARAVSAHRRAPAGRSGSGHG